jgi:hypothetical protein
MKDLQGRILLYGLRVQLYQRLVQIPILQEKKLCRLLVNELPLTEEKDSERGKSCIAFPVWVGMHCKDSIPKIRNKFSQKARPQSQIPHSLVCDRFIYSQNGSAYSAAGKYVDEFWEYINRSQTHECGYWD